MTLSVIFPVIALIIGWALNEFTRHLGSRQKAHDAIGQALSELLIVRTHIVNIKAFSDILITDLKLPKNVIPKYKQFYTELIPFSGKELDRKIRDSVTIIASFNPLLAAAISFNISTTNVFTQLSSNIEGNEASDDIYVDFLMQLEDKYLPFLDEAILTLARKHGLFTYFRVKRIINKELRVPEETKNILLEFSQKLDNEQLNESR